MNIITQRSNRWISVSVTMWLLCLLFFSCDNDRKHPGYVYFPDMVESEAYETYNPNPNFTDGKTEQQPQQGTIPREMIPYQYEKSDEGMVKAGLELKNPYEINEENMARGKVEYEIYCGICHGKNGRGEGLLYKSGKYPTEPASLVTPDMVEKPEGELYHTITLGSVIMQAHASQLREEDRWKIIMYIVNDLQKIESDSTN